MKKILLLSTILSLVLSTSAFASDSSYKDDVLFYADHDGSAIGYDLLWKAEDITGTFPQESAVIRKDDVVYVTSLTLLSGTGGYNYRNQYPGNNDLFALDANTGEIIDQVEIGPTFGDPRIDGDTLYVVTGD